MVISTTVLEPKRNPRNFPRKGLGSGPRIPQQAFKPMLEVTGNNQEDCMWEGKDGDTATLGL
jgi:hypothetical protein